MKHLRLFHHDRLYADPQGLESCRRLQSIGLKKFEFTLRCKADAGE
jgi:hypothetical protein